MPYCQRKIHKTNDRLNCIFKRILRILQKKQIMELNEYLDSFENKLQQTLLRLCTNYKFLDGTLLATDDIDEYWQTIAPEYIADAVTQVQDYPTVSVAWASYIGMAVAYGWDIDWNTISKAKYKDFYGEQGFDDMDEHLVRDVIGMPLESNDARDIEEIIRRCGETTVDLIRREQIEPQSATAYHVFTRAVKVMYRTGAAIQLKRMGYKFEKVNIGDC